MNKLFRNYWAKFLGTIFLFVLAFAVYWPILNSPLVSDDYLWCWQGQNHGDSIFSGLFQIMRFVLPFSFRPVPLVTWWAQCSIFGSEGLPSHIFNVSLFAAIAGLLYLFLVQAGTGRPAAYLAATLFVVTPIAPEAVTYSSSRSDLLGLFFMFLALICYLRFTKNYNRLMYLASLGAFTISLLCKEEFGILVILIPLLELFFGGHRGPQTDFKYIRSKTGFVSFLKRMAPFGAVTAAYLLAMRLTMPELGGVNARYLPRRILLPGSGVFQSIKTILSPLSIFEFSNLTINILSTYVAILLIASVLLILKKGKKNYQESLRLYAFMVVLILIAPVPTFHTIYNKGIGRDLQDSHLLFLSTMGVIVLLALGFDVCQKIKRWRFQAGAAAIVLFLFFTWGLMQNNKAWKHNAVFGLTVAEKTKELLPDPPDDARFYYQGLKSHPNGAWLATSFLYKYPLCFQYGSRVDEKLVVLTFENGKSVPPLEPGDFLFTVDERDNLLIMETPDGNRTSVTL